MQINVHLPLHPKCSRVSILTQKSHLSTIMFASMVDESVMINICQYLADLEQIAMTHHIFG